MKSYAGIGSRDISEKEKLRIESISKLFSSKGYILYSGNADGTDLVFQKNCKGKCVIMLPWRSFNIEKYDYTKKAKDYLIIKEMEYKKSIKAFRSVDEFHPNPKALKTPGKLLMARNYYQIHGFGEYPRVELVICCADPSQKNIVKGGTGQAVRIAMSLNIPIINLREDGWYDKIRKTLYG